MFPLGETRHKRTYPSDAVVGIVTFLPMPCIRSPASSGRGRVALFEEDVVNFRQSMPGRRGASNIKRLPQKKSVRWIGRPICSTAPALGSLATLYPLDGRVGLSPDRGSFRGDQFGTYRDAGGGSTDRSIHRHPSHPTALRRSGRLSGSARRRSWWEREERRVEQSDEHLGGLGGRAGGWNPRNSRQIRRRV